MTNRVRRIITVFLIAVTLFTAVPLTVSAAEKLEAPTNFRWEGLTLRWDAVENADHYEVTMYQSDDLINPVFENAVAQTNSFDLEAENYDLYILAGKTYIAEVRACGSSAYVDSDASQFGPNGLDGIMLYGIPHVQLSSAGILSWNAYDHYTDRMTGYRVDVLIGSYSRHEMLSPDTTSLDMQAYVGQYYSSMISTSSATEFEIRLTAVSEMGDGYSTPISDTWTGTLCCDSRGKYSWIVSFQVGNDVYATGSMESVRLKKGRPFTAPEPFFAPKDSVVFDYWTVGSDETTKYYVGDPVTVNDNITMTAHWKYQTGISGRIQGDYLYWSYWGAHHFKISILNDAGYYIMTETVDRNATEHDLFQHCARHSMAPGTYRFNIQAENGSNVQIGSPYRDYYTYDPDSSGRATVVYNLNVSASAGKDVDFPKSAAVRKGVTFGTLWDGRDIRSMYPEGVPNKVFQWWYEDWECTVPMSADYVINGNKQVYAKWVDAIRTVAVNIPTPRPGNAEDDYDYNGVKTSGSDEYSVGSRSWVRKEGDLFLPFIGTFEEGETYYMWLSLQTNGGNRAFDYSYKEDRATFVLLVNNKSSEYLSGVNNDPFDTVNIYVPVKATGHVSVTSVVLDRDDIDITVGDTAQLHATVYPENATNKNLIWLSIYPDIAEIDGNGLITAKKPGFGVVSAVSEDDPDHYYICHVRVLFKDVNKSADFFFEPVYWALDRGITTGYTGKKEGYFGPKDECTRGQIVTFLWRYAGSPQVDPSGAPTFHDVKQTDYFYKAVIWAASQGITTGYTDKNGDPTGYFGSNDECTRAQIVTFLYRFAGEPAVDTSSAPAFKDVKSTDYFYRPVIWAASKGITTGYTDSHGNPTGKFGSGDGCTRGQVVTFLYRYDRIS